MHPPREQPAQRGAKEVAHAPRGRDHRHRRRLSYMGGEEAMIAIMGGGGEEALCGWWWGGGMCGVQDHPQSGNDDGMGWDDGRMMITLGGG